MFATVCPSFGDLVWSSESPAWFSWSSSLFQRNSENHTGIGSIIDSPCGPSRFFDERGCYHMITKSVIIWLLCLCQLVQGCVHLKTRISRGDHDKVVASWDLTAGGTRDADLDLSHFCRFHRLLKWTNPAHQTLLPSLRTGLSAIWLAGRSKYWTSLGQDYKQCSSLPQTASLNCRSGQEDEQCSLLVDGLIKLQVWFRPSEWAKEAACVFQWCSYSCYIHVQLRILQETSVSHIQFPENLKDGCRDG